MLALRFKLVIVSLLERNLNQQISLLIFMLLILHAQLTLTKNLFYLHLSLTQPYQTSSSWAFFIIAISLKFYLSPWVKLQIT